MSKSMNRRVRPSLLVAAAGIALGVSAASAQAQVSWLSAVSDSWFNNARWSGGAYPNSSATNAAISVAGTYTVTMQNGSALVGTLTLGNANATLNLFDNCNLNVYGNTSNAGLIQVGSPGAPGNNTYLNAAAPIAISGSGTLRLAAAGSNGDSAAAYLYHSGNGANIFTNASGHKIAGYGRIYAGLVNNGTVNGDINGKGLFFVEQTPTNNATVTASNGGFVMFRSVALSQGSSGVCLSSNSSPIQFQNASVSGGTLNGTGTSSGIQYYGTNSVSGVTMTNSNVVVDNSSVHIGAGGVVNNGTWTINDPAGTGNNTHVDADVPNATISGTGTLRLQATAQNGDGNSAYIYHNSNGANTLVNGASHSIKGYGRIYVGLVNNGTVNADITNKGLFFVEQPATNNGTMTASNGGFLQFRSVTVTGNPAAQIISTDSASPVQMVNATMTGGGFTTSGTGLFQYYGTNTLSNLTVNGTHQIVDNSSAHLATNLVNNGTWKINDPAGPGNNTRLEVDASVSITGTGTITLQATGQNGDGDSAYIYHNGNGANVLTLGSGQTLNGYGRVYAGVINNGLINANTSGKGIYLFSIDKTNNTTITSSNSGYWYIRGITLTNNGTLSSSNTSTGGGGFENCTVNGGSITNVSNQAFGTSGTVGINGSTITAGSTIQVNDNTTLNTTGLTNNGTIFVNSPGGAGNTTRFMATVPNATLNGTGVLRLAATGQNGDGDSAYLWNNANSSNTLVNSATHSVRGYGRIYVNLINNGTVNADISGKGLYFLNDAKNNNATITSSNGGYWFLNGTTINNGASGVMTSSNTATPGGYIQNSTINNGSLTNISAQNFVAQGTNTLSGITLTTGSGIQVEDNSTLNIANITNNGTIYVQRVNGPGNSTRLIAPSTATISGTGTVRLQSTGFTNDTGYIWGQGDAAHPLTLTSGQTLSGTGRAYGTIVANGIISPDQPFGTPNAWGSIQPLSGAFTYGATSTYNVQIKAAGQYDSMQGNSAITIASGAALNIAFDPSYVPNSGDIFDLVVGGSVTGKFTTVNITGLGSFAGGPAHIVYLPDRVRLVMCYANADGSSTAPTLTAADFTAFLAAFRTGDAYANCDGSTGSPTLTAADFTCFLTKFRVGCN